MKLTVLVAALAAIPLASSAAEPAGDPSAPAARTAVAKLSPDRVIALRRSLTAQMAVYDATEGAMRAPTPAEAAALAPQPASGTSATFRVRGGGIGARIDPSQISLLVVEPGIDGKPVVSHGGDARKEARHAR